MTEKTPPDQALAKYLVESVESNELPEPNATYLTEGRFDTFEEARERAKAVVRKSLQRMMLPGITAERLARMYSTYGDVPMIHGEPKASFQPFDYAREIIPELLAKGPAVPVAPKAAAKRTPSVGPTRGQLWYAAAKIVFVLALLLAYVIVKITVSPRGGAT
jgi:hypothetical protein